MMQLLNRDAASHRDAADAREEWIKMADEKKSMGRAGGVKGAGRRLLWFLEDMNCFRVDK